MRIERAVMVPLGYGKYFRSDRIVGLAPIEQERGPGRRTFVYIEGIPEPLVASRSEGAILRDMTQTPREVTKARELFELLNDVAEAIDGINPMLRSIIRDQGHWDLDRFEERIRDLLAEEEQAGVAARS